MFWLVAGSVEIGTTAHLEGNVLTQTSIMMSTGVSINGRLFAQTAVNLDGNAVVELAVVRHQAPDYCGYVDIHSTGPQPTANAWPSMSTTSSNRSPVTPR